MQLHIRLMLLPQKDPVKGLDSRLMIRHLNMLSSIRKRKCSWELPKLLIEIPHLLLGEAVQAESTTGACQNLGIENVAPIEDRWLFTDFFSRRTMKKKRRKRIPKGTSSQPDPSTNDDEGSGN
ncbi:hypothetical protein M9H77_05487 [Catharanthus roseus]|uniref:Uncharacterized protein n=1 Tax=Catharanthus roseus TaxID=4058 RepID=A0ACC0CH24_CATRO|nr:hypothetical protein M9H77_05487 [Catharanthus roseus]